MSKAGISRKSCLQGKARMLISHGKMSRCHGQKRKLKHVIPRRQTSLWWRVMCALKPPRSAPWRPGKARHAKQPSTPTSGRLAAARSSSPLGRHNFHFSTNKFGFEQTQTFFLAGSREQRLVNTLKRVRRNSQLTIDSPK